MTNNARGSSLLQARKNQHLHGRSLHAQRDTAGAPHAHLHDDYHRRRQADRAREPVTEVVQTVSILKYVDENGATLDIKTYTTPPLTQLRDPLTGATLDSSGLNSILPTAPLSLSVPDLPVSTGVDSKSGSASSHEATPLTSAPFPGPSAYSSHVGGFNSSSASVLRSFNNSTLHHSFFLNTTRSSSSTLSSSSSSLTSITFSFRSSATRTQEPSVTAFGGFPAGGTPEGTVAPSATSSSTSEGTGGQPPVPTQTVVGGVLGGLAGVALLLVIALWLLRWKKRQQQGHQRLANGSGGGDSRLSLDMTDRGLPFAIPATLAALSGGKRKSQVSSTGGASSEKGFQRISGKKLPSVIQHGGDGFSDPRESVISDVTDMSFFRDSTAFFGGPNKPRYAVGSPMRPESGIPVWQPGPGRTPVQSPITPHGPGRDFANPPARDLTPPRNLTPDAVGRSHPSQDGSRGSASRFTENIS